eukprot:Amastigsp_a847512_22.p4 type:complete len:157 gc:universal Amastigsp_a847512_22:351-821(+)
MFWRRGPPKCSSAWAQRPSSAVPSTRARAKSSTIGPLTAGSSSCRSNTTLASMLRATARRSSSRGWRVCTNSCRCGRGQTCACSGVARGFRGAPRAPRRLRTQGRSQLRARQTLLWSPPPNRSQTSETRSTQPSFWGSSLWAVASGSAATAMVTTA